MKTLKIIILFGFFIAALSLSFYSYPVSKAQSSSQQVGVVGSQTALGVQPTIVEVVLTKDGLTKREIEIYNLTNQAIPMKATKQSFTSQNKEDISKDKLGQYDSSSWITLSDSDTDFILQPQEIKKVTLTIQPPVNASPGGHYATIYFQPLIPAELISKDSAYVYVRVAVLVLMQNPGEIAEAMEIEPINLQTLYENFPIDVNLTLKNTGNIHLLPIGKVTIYNDLTNEVVQTIDIKDELSLPGLDKKYNLQAKLPDLFGKFSVQAVVNYGVEKKVIMSDKMTFYVVPYKQILLILVLLLVIFILRKRIIRAARILFTTKDKKAPAKIKPIIKKQKRVKKSLKKIRKSVN